MGKLSVVVITKNLEWNIPRLIESIMSEAADIGPVDIVLVDSASTDKTVDLACQYPIKVISLDPNQRLTAAAGRYIGYHQTKKNDYILFIDGDFELGEGWLPTALEFMEQDPDIATITGYRIDLPPDTPNSNRKSYSQPKEPPQVKPIPTTGGSALYRRAVLEEVGTFHPYIYSDEEPELCIRIRSKGYKIVQINRLIGLHYSLLPGKISTLISRWKRRLFLGTGQCLRHNFGKETFWLYVRERGFGCLPMVGLAVGTGAFLISFILGTWLWFGLWGLSVIAVIAGYILVKRNLYKALYTIVARALFIDGTIRGFLLKPIDPDITPIKFNIVKDID